MTEQTSLSFNNKFLLLRTLKGVIIKFEIQYKNHVIKTFHNIEQCQYFIHI